MQSFRTEIENPVVERDIIELEKKIRLFREAYDWLVESMVSVKRECKWFV